MNALTPTNQTAPTLESLRISAPLWRLLSSRLPAETEVEEICRDPVLHREAQVVAPMLKAAAGGCGEDAVSACLAPLVLVFGVSDAARSSAFWRIYKQQLAEIPLEALQRAVDEYAGLPDSQFFPKPGPLKALALKHAQPIYQAASRAKRAASAPLLPQRPPPTPEQIEAVRRLARAPLKVIHGDRDA